MCVPLLPADPQLRSNKGRPDLPTLTCVQLSLLEHPFIVYTMTHKHGIKTSLGFPRGILVPPEARTRREQATKYMRVHTLAVLLVCVCVCSCTTLECPQRTTQMFRDLSVKVTRAVSMCSGLGPLSAAFSYFKKALCHCQSQRHTRIWRRVLKRLTSLCVIVICI